MPSNAGDSKFNKILLQEGGFVYKDKNGIKIITKIPLRENYINYAIDKAYANRIDETINNKSYTILDLCNIKEQYYYDHKTLCDAIKFIQYDGKVYKVLGLKITWKCTIDKYSRQSFNMRFIEVDAPIDPINDGRYNR